ncbi:TBC1 domain family member 8 [Sciurus carolinensis]|uniref:TBC1 domain family member 8 n=1 Tax=Sciurus carolinensis TaxID=30640 RepID=A0AA41TBY7_SCICA|nr:TBC1 domain family member 8 [Sciurus carolinensis]
MSLSSQVCLLLFCLVGGPVGALEEVLDSNTEVAPFQVLLQVPGSQVYSPIACGEFLDGCDIHCAIATVQLVIPWVDIQKLERTANVFVADTIRITTQNKERDSSMFLILYVVLKIMEQLVDVMLRRLLDNELWTPFSRFHTAGRMISSDSSTCFASREDGCYNVVLPLREVVSMEKMEDTSLLPSPILISIRSKMAFQFIELKDRETLEETLLERLKQVHANHPVHYDTSTNDKDMLLLPWCAMDTGGWAMTMEGVAPEHQLLHLGGEVAVDLGLQGLY